MHRAAAAERGAAGVNTTREGILRDALSVYSYLMATEDRLTRFPMGPSSLAVLTNGGPRGYQQLFQNGAMAAGLLLAVATDREVGGVGEGGQ